MYSELVFCQIYITSVSQKQWFSRGHEKSQLLTDPNDVNLKDNQLSIHDKFYLSAMHKEEGVSWSNPHGMCETILSICHTDKIADLLKQSTYTNTQLALEEGGMGNSISLWNLQCRRCLRIQRLPLNFFKSPPPLPEAHKLVLAVTRLTITHFFT